MSLLAIRAIYYFLKKNKLTERNLGSCQRRDTCSEKKLGFFRMENADNGFWKTVT